MNPSQKSAAAPGRKIRWGVLGYARIARESLIPAIQRSSNSEFHAIASRDEAKLSACRAQFNGPKTFRGYDELLRDPDVDVVYIPLPNSLHREWTIKAAEQGKHVFCEKPIALNAAECREMMAACAANRVTLMEAFMYRYTDRTRKVQEVLRSGALGEIKFISSTFRFLLANPASINSSPNLAVARCMTWAVIRSTSRAWWRMKSSANRLRLCPNLFPPNACATTAWMFFSPRS
jgi:xylose dehydrogenase (NAD/NADP)